MFLLLYRQQLLYRDMVVTIRICPLVWEKGV